MQRHGMPLHSLVLMVAFVVSVFKFPKNPFVWAAVPFFVVHSVVGHKEMRFLFPLATIAPVFLLLFLIQFSKVLKYKKLTLFFVSTNFLALIFLCVWPSRAEVLLQTKVYEEKANTLVYLKKNPYNLGDHPVYFTRPTGLKVLGVASLDDYEQKRKTELLAPHLFSSTTSEYDLRLQGLNCHEIWQVFPRWVARLIYDRWLESAGDYKLYSCN